MKPAKGHIQESKRRSVDLGNKSRLIFRATDLQPAGPATRWAQVLTDPPVRELTQLLNTPVKRIYVPWNIPNYAAQLLDNYGAWPGGRA